jgi:hypothetical protein
MQRNRMFRRLAALCLLTALVLVSGAARAQKVFLNPSNQTNNAVSGGGTEDQYALIVANRARDTLTAAGFTVKVDQNFTNAPANANSWGADIFVSIHSNAGGGHGTETLYKSAGGKTLADHVQKGLLSKLPYQDRGLKYRDNLHVLNNTNMYACLLESVFHDCTSGSGFAGHPPSESAFLRSTDGQTKIAAGTAAGVCTYYNKSCGTSAPLKGKLTGVVFKDPDLNDRLPGAKVTVQGGASATYNGTDPWLFELEPGTYTVTASLAGYQDGSVTRDVTAGSLVWGSIGLKPVPEPVVDASVPDVKEAAAPPPDVVSITTDADAPEAGKPTSWDNSEDDSGCSCRAAASAPFGYAPALWLLAGAALLARRRRLTP